jgi:hypothetical protein
MDCDERDKLLAQYNAARRVHALAAANLEELRGSTPQLDYIHLRILADDTERSAQLAGEKLSDHIQQHACGDLALPGDLPPRA